MGASVVAGGDVSPILEFGERVLDLMALAVEALSEAKGRLHLRDEGTQGAMPLPLSASRNQTLF